MSTADSDFILGEKSLHRILFHMSTIWSVQSLHHQRTIWRIWSSLKQFPHTLRFNFFQFAIPVKFRADWKLKTNANPRSRANATFQFSVAQPCPINGCGVCIRYSVRNYKLLSIIDISPFRLDVKSKKSINHIRCTWVQKKTCAVSPCDSWPLCGNRESQVVARFHLGQG